jgi:hypothetical protein
MNVENNYCVGRDSIKNPIREAAKWDHSHSRPQVETRSTFRRITNSRNDCPNRSSNARATRSPNSRRVCRPARRRSSSACRETTTFIPNGMLETPLRLRHRSQYRSRQSGSAGSRANYASPRRTLPCRYFRRGQMHIPRSRTARPRDNVPLAFETMPDGRFRLPLSQTQPVDQN